MQVHYYLPLLNLLEFEIVEVVLADCELVESCLEQRVGVILRKQLLLQGIFLLGGDDTLDAVLASRADSLGGGGD